MVLTIAGNVVRPGLFPLWLRDVATTGEGRGDDKEFTRILGMPDGRIAVFFADGTSHFDGAASLRISDNGGRTSGPIIPVGQSLLPDSTRNYCVGIMPSGRVVVLLMRQTVGGTWLGNYHTHSDDLLNWSMPVRYDQSLGLPPMGNGAKMVDTVNGMLAMHWLADGTCYPIWMGANGLPAVVGDAFSLSQAGATSPSEPAIGAVTPTDIALISRNGGSNRFGLQTSADGGLTWAPRGWWSFGVTVPDNSYPALEIIGGEAHVTYAVRSAAAGGGVYGKIMDAAAFHADPVAALDAVPTIEYENCLPGSTYEEGYPDKAQHVSSRVLVGWHTEAPSEGGSSAKVVMRSA